MVQLAATITGGCFCRNIRYAIEPGAYHVGNCHCTMCRKTSGAPFVTWIVVSQAQFKYTEGKPNVLKSSTKGTRHFCADCGTPLIFFATDRPHKTDVTTGSLDDPNNFPPTSDVNDDTKLIWL